MDFTGNAVSLVESCKMDFVVFSFGKSEVVFFEVTVKLCRAVYSIYVVLIQLIKGRCSVGEQQ